MNDKYSRWFWFVECSECGYCRKTGLNRTGTSRDLFHTFGFDALCPDCGKEIYNGNQRFSSGTGRLFRARYVTRIVGAFLFIKKYETTIERWEGDMGE